MESREFIQQLSPEQEDRPSYEIRKAAPGDVVAIRTMHAQSWRDTYISEEHGVSADYINSITDKWLTSDALEKSVEYMAGVFDDPEHFYRVALLDGEVAGFVHANIREDGTRYLGSLYTDRSTHGTGLGQQLMGLVDEWAQGGQIDLEVASYNERAKSFYRKYGFVETGVPEGPRYDDIPTVVMTRYAGKIQE